VSRKLDIIIIGVNMSKKTKVLNIILICLSAVLLLASGVIMYQNICYFNVIIVGTSMHGTLENGEVGAVRKISLVNSLNRGDIVTFEKTSASNYEVIKRIIGLPGEHVLLTGNQIFINDQLLDENYLLDGVSYYNTKVGTSANYDVTLKENEYYVLGDNRGVSSDSRTYGPVNKSQFTGKLRLIYAKYECESTNTCDEPKNRQNISWRWF
jgi:signal peptidase I